MFMVSFMFVRACGRFEWNRMCGSFYRVFVYVRSNYQEGSAKITLTAFISPHMCAFPKTESTLLIVFRLVNNIPFANISIIVDHQLTFHEVIPETIRVCT
jgi:hypothetical protein